MIDNKSHVTTSQVVISAPQKYGPAPGGYDDYPPPPASDPTGMRPDPQQVHELTHRVAELEASKSECRNYSSEVQGIKNNKNDEDEDEGDDNSNIRCTASRPPTRRPPSNLTLSVERTRLTSFRYFLKI